MEDWKLPWNGGCRCGRVRFRVTQPPMLAVACHCAGCQRMSASAFSLSLSLNVAGFEITQGEPVLGGLQQEPKHYHCPFCKSWMFTKPSSMPWFMNLRATMLDDPAWVVPFVEVYRGEGFAWAATGAKHSFETIASQEQFGALIQAYAEEGARP